MHRASPSGRFPKSRAATTSATSARRRPPRSTAATGTRGALLGSGGNEGIVGGKATSKATRGSTPSATNSVLAACTCSFRPLLAAHSQSRAPVQGATTTTSTPKGSVSASGWLSWPKLCWPNVLCTIYICLIAASGGAFAYFSHGSDGLLPSVVVPVSAAPGFERHAGFCDLNGGKCQEEYRGFGESAELCEQRCLEFPAGARACTAVEYWHLTKGCVGLLAPNGCCFCPNTFTHIQYIQIYSTLFDIILRRKWHIQSETHSHFFRILRHAMRASRAIRSRAHSGRTFMAFGRDTFRENLHLITFNLIPVACIHANSCWSHSCIF